MLSILFHSFLKSMSDFVRKIRVLFCFCALKQKKGYIYWKKIISTKSLISSHLPRSLFSQLLSIGGKRTRRKETAVKRSLLSSSSSFLIVRRLREPGTMAAGFLIRTRLDARRKKRGILASARGLWKRNVCAVRCVRYEHLITRHVESYASCRLRPRRGKRFLSRLR